MAMNGQHKFGQLDMNSAKKCHNYFVAARPWSFTASLTPVALGTTLAYKVHGVFSVPVLLLVCLTAIAVHAAGNLVNTYYDYKRGVDTKKSDDRTLVEGRLSDQNVATLGGLFYGLGCVGLFGLCLISPAKENHLALIYFCGLSSSFLYTGGLGLKYIALGDIIIFLTFGPLTVLFSFLAQSGSLSLVTIPYAIPLALNIECVLHANNCRDRIADKQAGIVTLAIILGPMFSYLLFCVLLFGPFVAFGYCVIHVSPAFFLPFVTIFMAFPIERSFRAGEMKLLPQRIAVLNLVLGLMFVVAICAAPKSGLPFIS